jgi:predicted phosphoribosyltransferase
MLTDRADAGRQLAARLESLRTEDPVVLGLPRGGVAVAFEIAGRLGAPLDVTVVRKLGLPRHREVAMGALAEGGVTVVNHDVLHRAGVSDAEFAAVRDAEQVELDRRLELLRRGLPRVPVRGRTVVVVDDGIATGATARAACLAVREAGASRVVLAVPVAASDALTALRDVAGEIVCLQTPPDFVAVGRWYRDFAQVSDEEVVRLLADAG